MRDGAQREGGPVECGEHGLVEPDDGQRDIAPAEDGDDAGDRDGSDDPRQRRDEEPGGREGARRGREQLNVEGPDSSSSATSQA